MTTVGQAVTTGVTPMIGQLKSQLGGIKSGIDITKLFDQYKIPKDKQGAVKSALDGVTVNANAAENLGKAAQAGTLNNDTILGAVLTIPDVKTGLGDQVDGQVKKSIHDAIVNSSQFKSFASQVKKVEQGARDANHSVDILSAPDMRRTRVTGRDNDGKVNKEWTESSGKISSALGAASGWSGHELDTGVAELSRMVEGGDKMTNDKLTDFFNARGMTVPSKEKLDALTNALNDALAAGK